MTQIDRLIEVARRELGYTENPPGSNRTKYGREYGMDGVPWCVIFLWWVFREAGLSKLFFGGAKTASCGELLRWAKREGLTMPVSAVHPGDIVILDFSGTGDTQHCGLVVEVSRLLSTIGYIRTIEGNTTPGAEGSQDNGGSVALKTRYPRQIVRVCRPMYKVEEELKPTMRDDIKGHWAEEAIRRCIKRGIFDGYPDGTFAPDKIITRAEVAVVIDRLISKLIGEDDGK